ncbi:MAG: oligosaccharide flippase family protein [Chloroflexaceae bacterium]|nr:oligosaccharide flippase family protein [Chloroflexaceae bacterium]
MVFILRYISRPTWTVDMPFASSMIKGVLPFLGLESVIAIWASLNALILSRVGNEIDVAMYNAAMQVLVPVSLVLQSIVMSLFPMMCREYETGGSGMQVVYEDLMELLLMVTLPAVVGIIFLAEPILLLFMATRALPMQP